MDVARLGRARHTGCLVALHMVLSVTVVTTTLHRISPFLTSLNHLAANNPSVAADLVFRIAFQRCTVTAPITTRLRNGTCRRLPCTLAEQSTMSIRYSSCKSTCYNLTIPCHRCGLSPSTAECQICQCYRSRSYCAEFTPRATPKSHVRAIKCRSILYYAPPLTLLPHISLPNTSISRNITAAQPNHKRALGKTLAMYSTTKVYIEAREGNMSKASVALSHGPSETSPSILSV